VEAIPQKEDGASNWEETPSQNEPTTLYYFNTKLLTLFTNIFVINYNVYEEQK
jgi:hypothetical protein